MKIQLRSLRVINCGPLRDVYLDFCDPEGNPEPIIVLAGANGSGKTTVLELITQLADRFDPAAYHKLVRVSNAEDSTILDRTEYAQADWMIDDDKFSYCYGRPPKDATINGNFMYFGKTEDYPHLSLQRTTWEKVGQTIEENRFQRLDFPDYLPQGNADVLPSILVFPHLRFIEPVEGDQIYRADIQYQWVYRYEAAPEYEGSLDSYLIWLDYAEPEIFSRVIEFLNSLDFDGKTFGIQRKELKATVTTKDGQTHFLEQLSSGEQNILVMLLELRRRLLPHSIVLIDEIENSLHPAYQYKLALALKKMQESIPFQLIVTTHAPAFLDIFGTGSVRILTEF